MNVPEEIINVDDIFSNITNNAILFIMVEGHLGNYGGIICIYGNDSHYISLYYECVCVSMCVVACMRTGYPYELIKSECP